LPSKIHPGAALATAVIIAALLAAALIGGGGGLGGGRPPYGPHVGPPVQLLPGAADDAAVAQYGPGRARARRVLPSERP
jgi:hypothetical protein